VCQFLHVKCDPLNKVSAVWEDHQAALKLATAQFPNMSPHTKHIACKYHWFRTYIQPDFSLQHITSATANCI